MKEKDERIIESMLIPYKSLRGINRNAIFVVERDEMGNSHKRDLENTSL